MYSIFMPISIQLGSFSCNFFILIQMYEELQVLSPLVSTREFYFLRYCQQIEQGLWAIVDVSYDFPQDNHFAPPFRSHRLPSGCFVQDMPNGYSKVTSKLFGAFGYFDTILLCIFSHCTKLSCRLLGLNM